MQGLHLFMTYFYRAGGGAWTPRPPGSATENIGGGRATSSLARLLSLNCFAVVETRNQWKKIPREQIRNTRNIELQNNDQWRIYVVKFWMHAPSGSKFFQFHAILGNFWQNCMLPPPSPPERWRPHLWEILDPLLMIHLWVSWFPPTCYQRTCSLSGARISTFDDVISYKEVCYKLQMSASSRLLIWLWLLIIDGALVCHIHNANTWYLFFRTGKWVKRGLHRKKKV